MWPCCSTGSNFTIKSGCYELNLTSHLHTLTIRPGGQPTTSITPLFSCFQVRNNFSHSGEHGPELLLQEGGCSVRRGFDREERGGDSQADAKAERDRWRLRQRQRGQQPSCPTQNHPGMCSDIECLPLTSFDLLSAAHIHLAARPRPPMLLSRPQNLERTRQNKKRAIGTLDVAFKKRFFALSGEDEAAAGGQMEGGGATGGQKQNSRE